MRFFQMRHSSYNHFRYAWKDISFTGFDERTCPNCGRIIRSMTYQDDKYQFLLEGGKNYPDWLQFTGAGELPVVLSECAVEVLQKEGITGFSVKCEAGLYIEKKENQIEKVADCPKYFVVDVWGRIDYDYSSMFLKRKRKCTLCNQFSLNRERIYPVYLNESLWDGSDLCCLLTFPRQQYCTDHFAQVIKRHKLSGFEFYEAKGVQRRQGTVCGGQGDGSPVSSRKKPSSDEEGGTA